MMGRLGLGSVASVAVLATLALCFPPPSVWAGTTGKLTGTVLDAKKQPLAGANVALADVRLGTVTDAEGRFVIYNVPAGTHTMKVGLIGYAATTLTGVEVPADRTATYDVTLQESAVQLQEVVVSAQRPVVELGLTSNVATITRAQIAKLPVQELQDVVNLQAGVVDGHIRGGRKGEVQYQIDGVTVNNPYDNASTVRLDRSILEEVQVISGTFDAEYGQAMSGVVNAVLRRGTEHFAWSGELLGGGFVYNHALRGPPSIVSTSHSYTQPFDNHFDPAGVQNYQLTLTGPTGLPNTLFLLSARHYAFDDYVQGQRRFMPTDHFSAESLVFVPTGDNKVVTLGYSRDWLGVAKLTNRSVPSVEMTYQAIVNKVTGRRFDWAYRFDPEGLSRQRTFSIVHGLDWTQTLDTKTLFKFVIRQNYFDYRDMAYDSVNDARYFAAGPPLGIDVYEHGAVVKGVQSTRFIQNTNATVIGGSLTRNFSRGHSVKGGVEWQPTRLRFGLPGHLTVSGGNYVPHENAPPDFPAPALYRPVIGTAYAQDDLEWNDLRFRAGLRYDYFNSKWGVPSNLANPANSIAGAPPSHMRPTTNKIALSPRIGVSYPVTSKASLFFAYGHFIQMPLLRDIFTNADYNVLANLQADGVDHGVMGNPDVKPERTTQYQFGYKHELKPWLGLDVTLFYKDIRDLIGVRILTTYNNAEYRQLSNADFGSVTGLTVALDQRAIGALSTSLDYTWQLAKGSASEPNETATRVDAGEDPRPRQVPLDWDQRHTLNLTATLSQPDNYAVSGVLRVASGQPYTPSLDPGGFSGGLEHNSGRKPPGVLMDIRAEKQLGGRSTRWTSFARVFNLFDTRFFNGFVFNNTGSPYYTSTLSSNLTPNDARQLSDPTRYYGPRRIELGITFAGGDQ
jgi:outer membrane receptor protein involved in Fe transport